MPLERLIFVGFELTDELCKGFDDCLKRDRIYLDDPSHLEIVSIDELKYIGKRVKSGAPIDRIEDTARSVVSLLARVNKSWHVDSDKILIMAVEDSRTIEIKAGSDEKEQEDDADCAIPGD